MSEFIKMPEWYKLKPTELEKRLEILYTQGWFTMIIQINDRVYEVIRHPTEPFFNILRCLNPGFCVDCMTYCNYKGRC